MPPTQPIAADTLAGMVRIASFSADGQDWAVWEDLRSGDGELLLLDAQGQGIRLAKRIEPTYATANPPYLGLSLREIARADADLLAQKLLEGGGDPDEEQVRRAAPPLASDFNPRELGSRMAWTTFVGTIHAGDTMPIFPNGRDRCFRPEHVFPELSGDEIAKRREEGLLGGWYPAVHKVIPLDKGRWYDLLVFADVNANDPLVVQTWHRTILVEHGKAAKITYGHSYTPYPPRRQPPEPAQFYTALLSFLATWRGAIADMAPVELPRTDWADMARHAFVKELMVRPGGTYPKYGAVDRDYFGPEYDGFQDTFTSSLYANLEWGRFEQAKAVLDNYFTQFVFDDGMINMRGPETAQFGLTLGLLARYLTYTGDVATLRKYRGKIAATAQILAELHDQSLALPPQDRGHGLIHGWSESDACLHPDPSLWWKPYYNNSAFAVRGWRDIAKVWTSIDPGGQALAKSWESRAEKLQQALIKSMRANVRRDLSPAYISPLPGAQGTFREALATHQRNEQGWSHRVYCELLQADVLPEDLARLTVDCVRGHGGTVLGVVANFSAPNDTYRNLLGFITYGYAQELLRQDRIEEYLLFLYSHRHHAHTPGGWVAAEVAGIDGGLPLFCIPAQLTIPLLLRWMLVFERADSNTLHLGRAIPRDWIMSGQKIAISDAPTRWGRVSYALSHDLSNKRITIEGQLPENGPESVEMRVRLARGLRLRQLTSKIPSGTARIASDDTIVISGTPQGSFSLSVAYG